VRVDSRPFRGAHATSARAGRLKTREAARVGHPSADHAEANERHTRRMVDAGAEGGLEPPEHAPP
jgi:hypothetical protein